MRPKLYYGLPESQWDVLLAAAEDILRDKELGSHLVGIYPAGNRIYGIESEPPGIFCLYIDSTESLINPSVPIRSSLYISHIGLANSLIIMADLFIWSKWIIHRTLSLPNIQFLHAIPFGYDVIYQDDSINDILEKAQKYMISTKFFMPISLDSHNFTYITTEQELLYKRAKLILAITGSLYPCINPAWGKVYNITSLQIDTPKSIQALDSKLCNYFLKREDKLTLDEIQTLESWYTSSVAKIYSTRNEGLLEAKELGQAVANLYRHYL